MGNHHSITGFFSGRIDSQDEEAGILSYGIVAYKAIKGLFSFIISKLRWPKKRTSGNPILPIENPRAAPICTSNGYEEANKTVITSNVERANASPQHEIIFISDSDSVSNEEDDDKEEEEDITVISSVERVWCEANDESPKDKRIFVPDSVSNKEEEEEKEDKTVIWSSTFERIRWIKHYSSQHRILLVGDGDFSFSAALALAFGKASNMIATSLDSEAFLRSNYRKAHFNITELKERGCKVMHGIDATEIAGHAVLGDLKFDRIIYNFPFAGFFKNLSRDDQLRHHRRLVSLFLKNAREMMSENGEIHISHKSNGFHIEWNLESLALCQGLRLVEAVRFNHLDYPGYNTKCGFGGDNNFNCNPSKTYKFGFNTFGY